MSNFFDKLTGGGGGNSNNNNNNKKNQIQNPFAKIDNPFANLGKKKVNYGGGQSLGGSSTLGKVISISLNEPGPLGMKIEKRPNNEGSAIVSMVVDGGQAHVAGLQRGDILCHAGTDGQHEIMYNQFIAMASSDQRPLQFDIRRIQTKAAKTAGGGSSSVSAEAHARKQAVIAAAEKRERAHKQKSKPIPKTNKDALPALLSTAEKARLEKERQERANATATPMSEEAKKAVQQAKMGEEVHAAALGYNPYETARATAGQARTATVAMTHGSIEDKEGSSATQQQQRMAAPNRVAPPPSLPAEASNNNNNHAQPISSAFEEAMTTLITTNDHDAVKSSLSIMRKLVMNATTKGQTGDEASAAKFRRVRLSNAKIKAAIADMNGALELMLSTGFQLAEEDGETYLVFPPGDKGPAWLPNALKTMQDYEASS
mmetsp:Transcript_28064/g.39445  ORF Transcript_28064/g.39445 Transcript_28064/m.39445 type:complete len:430 (+) Transcript_28064:138-1427(+)